MKDENFLSFWIDALRALNRVNGYSHAKRNWWAETYNTYKLHPVVKAIVYEEQIRPADWHLLLLEWPHFSEDDNNMIAYTRNEAAGQSFLTEGSKRLTKTTVGKYLSRHWPHVPDHIRRNWAALCGEDKFEIWDTMEAIIKSVEMGPRSCMKSTSGSIPFTEQNRDSLIAYHEGTGAAEGVMWTRHPYICYAPEYGWRAAVRVNDKLNYPNIVQARAVVHEPTKSFVRTFMRGDSESDYSYSDTKLEAWLQKQGYSHNDGWDEGLKLKRVEHPRGGVMLPYIDGGLNRADDEGTYLRLSHRGSLVGDNTSGQASGSSSDCLGECGRCGDSVYEDDESHIYAGPNEDLLVCGCCADSYVYVRGARGSYSVHEDDVVRVNRRAYDVRNLPIFIIELHDGDYAHEDSCVYVEEENEYYLTDECVEDVDGNWQVQRSCVKVDDGDWYLKGDARIVKCEDDSEYRVKGKGAWQDGETDAWYSDNIDAIEVDDKKYHPNTVKQWLIDNGQTSLDLE
jgi:hypothetical protein